MYKITTIIPTYNRSKLLLRAMESALGQTCKDALVVVRDNNSSDDTEIRVRQISEKTGRVAYEKNHRNIGLVENVRIGIRDVKSDFFSFLCDDDYLEPEFYATGLKLLALHPDAAFVAFRVDTETLDGQIIHSNTDKNRAIDAIDYYKPEQGIKAFLRGELPTIITGYLFRKVVAQQIDFGEFAEVGYGADIFFIWHAASRFNFVVANSKGGTLTTHVNNASSTAVNVFDERFLYWWRKRLQIIMDDPLVSDVARRDLEAYYFTHSTKSLRTFNYYTHCAIIYIIKKLNEDTNYNFKKDFIAMQSFLPSGLLISLLTLLRPIVYLGLDVKIRKAIRFARQLQAPL